MMGGAMEFAYLDGAAPASPYVELAGSGRRCRVLRARSRHLPKRVSPIAPWQTTELVDNVGVTGVLKKGMVLLLVVFIGFYMFTDPNGLAQTTRDGAARCGRP